MTRISYRRHRFPPEIIQYAIWLYLRFSLSYRDVEELLAERGGEISYETVRRWVLKFRPVIARRLRRRRPQPSDRWHFDEMVVRIVLAYPFRQRARLSKTPAREQQPDLPVARWRQLVRPRDRRPRSFQRIGELRGEGVSHSRLPRRDDPAAQALKRSRHRDRAAPRSRLPAPPDRAPPRRRSGRSLACNRD